MLGILRGALELARGRRRGRGSGIAASGRRAGDTAAAARQRVVKAAHGAAKNGRQRGQPDVEDAGVAGRAAGLAAALLRRRHLQPDRAVQCDLDGIVVRGMGQGAQADVLKAALAPRGSAQALPGILKTKLVVGK